VYSGGGLGLGTGVEVGGVQGGCRVGEVPGVNVRVEAGGGYFKHDTGESGVDCFLLSRTGGAYKWLQVAWMS